MITIRGLLQFEVSKEELFELKVKHWVYDKPRFGVVNPVPYWLVLDKNGFDQLAYHWVFLNLLKEKCIGCSRLTWVDVVAVKLVHKSLVLNSFLIIFGKLQHWTLIIVIFD